MEPSSACLPWKNCEYFCDTLRLCLCLCLQSCLNFVFAPLTALIQIHTFLKNVSALKTDVFHFVIRTRRPYVSMNCLQSTPRWWGLSVFNIISSSALAGTIHLSTSEAWACGVGFVKLTLASCQWNIQVIEKECASTQHLAPVRNISL